MLASMSILAQDSGTGAGGGLFHWLSNLGSQELVFIIPIVAIVVVGIVFLVRSIFQHRERMGMIQQGIHPDQYKQDGGEKDEPNFGG